MASCPGSLLLEVYFCYDNIEIVFESITAALFSCITLIYDEVISKNAT